MEAIQLQFSRSKIFIAWVIISTIHNATYATAESMITSSGFGNASKKLDTSSTLNMNEIEQNNFQNSTQCPKACVCELAAVNCSQQELTSLYLMSYIENKANVTQIFLSSNLISKMNKDSLRGYADLRVLHLQFNIISYIQHTAFDTNNNLEEINLAENELINIMPDTFQKLVKLKKLYLNANQLSTMHKNIFVSLVNLKELDLSKNQLSHLPNTIFDKNRKLEYLNLAGNPLSSLHTDVLQYLHRLRLLNIAHAHFSAVPTTAISNLTSLEILNLANNFVEFVNQETLIAFLDIKRLKYVNLSQNPLICDCNLMVLQVIIFPPNVSSDGNNTYKDRAIECRNFDNPTNYTTTNILALNMICDYTNFTTLPPKANNKRKSQSTPSIGNSMELRELKYNPNLGWYTAGFLLAILLIFMIALIADKLKRNYHRRLRHKLRDLEQMDQNTESETANSVIKDTMLLAVTSQVENRPLNHRALVDDSKSEDNILQSNQRKKATCSAFVHDYSDIKPSAGGGIHNQSIAEMDHLLEQAEEETSVATDDTTKRVELAKQNARRNITLSNPHPDKNELIELMPGLKITNINPECPLHGSTLANAEYK